MVGTSWLVWPWPGTTAPKSSDPWAKTDRFDASNCISSITSAQPVSRGFLRDTSRAEVMEEMRLLASNLSALAQGSLLFGAVVPGQGQTNQEVLTI